MKKVSGNGVVKRFDKRPISPAADLRGLARDIILGAIEELFFGDEIQQLQSYEFLLSTDCQFWKDLGNIQADLQTILDNPQRAKDAFNKGVNTMTDFNLTEILKDGSAEDGLEFLMSVVTPAAFKSFLSQKHGCVLKNTTGSPTTGNGLTVSGIGGNIVSSVSIDKKTSYLKQIETRRLELPEVN